MTAAAAATATTTAAALSLTVIAFIAAIAFGGCGSGCGVLLGIGIALVGLLSLCAAPILVRGAGGLVGAAFGFLTAALVVRARVAITALPLLAGALQLATGGFVLLA